MVTENIVNLVEKEEQLEKKFSEIIFDILELDKFSDVEHLRETPKRIAKMYIRELLRGVYSDPKRLLKEFSMENKQENDLTPVVVRGIEVRSLCSHHFMPFYGTCDIIYIPHKTILGLSKFSRIVDHFSRKPQVQENLTDEIANFIHDNLEPHAVGVRIQATHLCMKHRGIKSNGTMETFKIIDQSGNYTNLIQKTLLGV